MGRVQARSVVRRAQSAEETGYQSAPSSADTRVRRVTRPGDMNHELNEENNGIRTI